MKFINKQKKNSSPRPLFKLTLIVVPMILIVLMTFGILYYNGFFMPTNEKPIGTWERTRIGEYSQKKYSETYTFNKDGTGKKAYTDKDGYTAETEFTWTVTEKKTLVIDGHIKYKWNSNYEEYFVSSDKVAIKYWYITKNELYIGKDTSTSYELYKRIK